MSNKKQIEASLKSLILDGDREFVAMLSGEWGIGKTYFWKEFTTKHLKEKNVVYISLFGKNSLADIETEVVTKLYRYNKGLKKYSKHLNTVSNMASKAIGLPINVSAGSLLSLFSPSDFKNIIICFDDFERLSDKVALKDVMGLISQFKEQKKCKVIMILNEKELNKLSDIDGKKHDEIFALYKEKVVDYTFHYKPNQKELFEAIKEDIGKTAWCESQTIYNFFEKIELKNIRIMKQALYQLNYFSFIEKENYNELVVNEFVEIVLNLSVFKAKTNYKYQAFKEMVGYRIEEEDRQAFGDMDNETPPTDEQKDMHEKALRHYHNLNFIYLKDQLEFKIYLFMDTHMINNEKIKELLQNQTSNMRYKQIHTNITNINLQYSHSFHSTDTETSQALKHALAEDKDSIHYIFTYSDFKGFIDNLNQFSECTLEEVDEKEIIKNYIKFYLDNPESNKHYRLYTKLCDDYDWATDYKTAYLSKDLSTDIALLPKIMASICDARFYSDDNQRQISVFDENHFKDSIRVATPEYIGYLVDVLSWSIGGNDLTPIKSKIFTALSELGDESDEFKRKAEAILKECK